MIGTNQRAKEYIKIRIDGKICFKHRKVWEDAHGKIPEGFMIHHKNGIKTDNRLENLSFLYII